MKQFIIAILLIVSNFAYYYKLSQDWLIMTENKLTAFTFLGVFISVISLIAICNIEEK